MASSARPRTEVPSRPRLLRSSMFVGGAIAAANALTALSQLALARLLRPADYSVLITMFVIITVVGVPLGAVQATIARTVADEHAERGAKGAGVALRESAIELLRLSVPAAILIVVVATPLAIVANIQHLAPLAATAATMAVSVALTLVWGGLQGTQRFGAFSLGQLAFSILKLAGAVGAAWAGAGVAGVLGAIAAAATATLLLAVIPLAPYLRASAGSALARRPLLTRYTGGAGAALTLFALMTSADVLVARLALRPSAAGSYAAASVIARALLLIPTAITTVFFPHVSTLRDPARERRHLLVAAGTTLLVSLSFAGVLLVVGGSLVELALGPRYASAGAWVGLLALVMALYAVSLVYLFHALAVGRTRFWRLGVLALAGQLLGFVLFHDSARELIAVQLLTAAVVVAGVEILDRRAR